MQSPYICTPEKMKLASFLLEGSVVQLVRMPPCHGGGRGFESRPVRKKPLHREAFLLKLLIRNSIQITIGSI